MILVLRLAYLNCIQFVKRDYKFLNDIKKTSYVFTSEKYQYCRHSGDQKVSTSEMLDLPVQ